MMKRRVLFIAFVALFSLFSCRGLIEYIKEAQQRGREQNESNFKVVFDDQDQQKPTEPKKQRRKKEDKPTSKSENHAYYEKKWNIPLNGTEDIVLLAEIDSWLGTPYKYGGATKEGTDCSGMVLSIYKKIYNIDTKRSAFDLWQQSMAVPREQLQCGDLVFFNINKKQVSHVGIYIANGYFVHASTSRGVIFDHLDTNYYAERFATGGRLKK